MELTLKPADCPLANVLQGIQGEIAHGDSSYNNRSHADIRSDYFLANPPYANFPWVRRCS